MPNPTPDPEKVPGTPGSLKLAAPERATRVSQAEMLRSLMARYESAGHERTNVEISRNAQGRPQVKVSVADENPDTALATAMRLYEAATLAYPYDSVSRPE